jgi:hypothetical protein
MHKNKINSVNGSDSFEHLLGGSNPEIREIAEALRHLVAEVLPGVTEVVWEKQGIAGYGIGPKKMSEQFCYIAPLKNHVNFGFYYGADLDDPSGLLEGTGKSLRHVKIRSKSEVASAELRKLLERASKYLPKLMS